MSTIHFINAVEYSELYPDFEVLPHADRVSLKTGDVAKICISFDGDPKIRGERFWVFIKSNAEGIYTGTVDNDLSHTNLHGLKNGDLVTFDYRHIYDYERGPFKNRA